MAANANLHKERIDTLLAIRVYHLDPSNARDMDNTCTTEVMQCLVRYALRPSFSNPVFAVAIKLAREKIAQLEFSVNKHLDIVTKHNVDFDVDRAAKPFTTESFKTLSTGFKKRPKQRINLRFLRRSVKGTKEKERSLLDPFLLIAHLFLRRKSRRLHLYWSREKEQAQQVELKVLMLLRSPPPLQRLQLSQVLY